MKAILTKMGMDFKAGEKNGSDVLNHRVRADFTDKNGVSVCADFGGYASRELIKKGQKQKLIIKNNNAMHVDGTYYDVEGVGRRYYPSSVGVNIENYSFTKADILKFLSDVTGNNYTELVIVD